MFRKIETSGCMADLGKTLNEISSQTEIVALNAAIESARVESGVASKLEAMIDGIRELSLLVEDLKTKVLEVSQETARVKPEKQTPTLTLVMGGKKD